MGIGGAGSNAVNNMINQTLTMDFIVANTDAQALENSLCYNRIQLGLENKRFRGRCRSSYWKGCS